MLKTCFKCGVAKPLDEFYAHPRMADGHLGKCKACTRADAKANRDANLVERREYDLQRKSRPERLAQRKRTIRSQRERHPEKNKARAAVTRALRTGRLVKQPCEVCGEPKVEAHHADYSQPLNVRWLCHTHHRIEHGTLVTGVPF